MTKEAHKTLKQFFTITNSAFTMMHSVSAAFGHIPTPTPMEMLHRMALSVLEQEEPDYNLLDSLLGQMEQLAQENKQNYENN